MLSDAAGEDEKVDTTEKCHVCADYLAHGSGKNIQRKSGVGIVGAHPLFKLPHIALAGRETKKAALMIEQIFKLIGAEFLIPQKVKEYARVEIAGARPHWYAAGGSEAHGGVDGYSVAKRAEACSVAKVREDGSPGKSRAEMMHDSTDALTLVSNVRVRVSS